MKRNFKKEVWSTQQSVTNAMQEVHATHGVPVQIQWVLGLTLLVCSMTWIERELSKTNDLNKRRKFIHEFDQRKARAERAVKHLRNECDRVSGRSRDQHEQEEPLPEIQVIHS